jgi:beta-lactamase superfamily II metal-dependent hydrolase
MDHYAEEDQNRLDLEKRLVEAIHSWEPQLTNKQAEAVLILGLAFHDLCKINVEGDLWGAVIWGKLLEFFRGARNQLDPVSLEIFAEFSKIVATAGLSTHKGWEHAKESAPKAVTPMWVCEARMTQWAVGQGGFWTTSGVYHARPSSRSFELVYDCGSSTSGGLDHSFRTYRPANGKIDYLFISHLDVDHTSGLDQLLARYQVNTVVMPLLTPAATLLIAARFAAHGDLEDQVVGLLTDPGTYLRERGVQRVILVQAAPEIPQGEAPNSAAPDEPPRERRPDAGEFRDIIVRTPPGNALSNPFAHAEVVPYATTFWLSGADHRPFWQLSPYVHPFEPLRIGRFMQSAFALLDQAGAAGENASVSTSLKSILSSAQRRSDLKRLYKLVRSDHNSNSMSLFSGPYRASRNAVYQIDSSIADGQIDHALFDSPRLGWMQTGDSTLARESYRRAWVSHYEKLLPRVSVMVLPHHGSKHNFPRELLSISAAPVALACASQNNPYGHPATVVARSAKATHSAYRQVDERTQTQVVGRYFDWDNDSQRS